LRNHCGATIIAFQASHCCQFSTMGRGAQIHYAKLKPKSSTIPIESRTLYFTFNVQIFVA
jgi:hypothetical protein